MQDRCHALQDIVISSLGGDVWDDHELDLGSIGCDQVVLLDCFCLACAADGDTEPVSCLERFKEDGESYEAGCACDEDKFSCHIVGFLRFLIDEECRLFVEPS